MAIRLFNYPGCKANYAAQINNIIAKAEDVNNYVEPFCGTASVIVNLDRSFNQNHISDFSREVICIISAFKYGTYDDFSSMYKNVLLEFGNIKESKEAYYNFRNTYNELHFKKDTIQEGIFLYMASRAAINSLFRIGPHGFNQSYGRRGDTFNMTPQEFQHVKDVLSNTSITLCDYRDTIAEHNNTTTLFFLDPPYVDRKIQGSYKDEGSFSQEDFFKQIKSIVGKIVYTDVFSDYMLEQLGSGWKYEILDNKITRSPGKNKGEGDRVDYQEAIYYNF